MQLHVGGKHHCESEKEDQKWKKMTWPFFKQTFYKLSKHPLLETDRIKISSSNNHIKLLK